MPQSGFLLYYHCMERRKSGRYALSAAVTAVLSALFVFPPFAPTSHADIYRWEDDAGVIHFTDDPSAVPSKYKGKVREILKSPPAAGEPSVSTFGGGAPARGDSVSSGAAAAERVTAPAIPLEDASGTVESLRAKIDAKERFVRAIDEKQSLATNPYRNRFVSPPDLELYRKYKEELPSDRERLKELESRLAPAREP